MKITQIPKFVASIFICLCAGVVGSFANAGNINTWYATLQKPVFNPPNWVFGPVWTILYIMIGIALYLVWQKWKKDKFSRIVFVMFLIHLFVNAMWSVVFFGLHDIGKAFLVIIVLWLMIIALMFLFEKIDRKATLLFVPYLLWVTFAAFLNFSIWELNSNSAINGQLNSDKLDIEMVEQAIQEEIV
ncbi:MAG: TspO/MBR family protein, partial [Patescibacteria group bacterium]